MTGTPGPPIQRLTRRLAETPSAFLAPVAVGAVLSDVLADLGPPPPPGALDELALWAAALVDPLPALRLAPPVRPEALCAADAAARLDVVTACVRESISFLEDAMANPKRGYARRAGKAPEKPWD